jgi:Ion channel
MTSRLMAAWCLMAVCVLIHAAGATWLFGWLRSRDPVGDRFRDWTWLFIRLAGRIVLLHLLAIMAWAIYYAWTGALPDLESAAYFSAVTYTTTGYGDVVLPAGWRLVGAVEALTGILLCGWSTAFFFAVLTRLLGQHQAQRDLRTNGPE